MATTPTITMMIEMTIATIGRLMKNFAIRYVVLTTVTGRTAYRQASSVFSPSGAGLTALESPSCRP